MTLEQAKTRQAEPTNPDEKLIGEVQKIQQQSALKTGSSIPGNATAAGIEQVGSPEPGSEVDSALRLFPKFDRVAKPANSGEPSDLDAKVKIDIDEECPPRYSLDAEGKEATQEEIRQREKREWQDRNGVLPTERLRDYDQSSQKELEDRLRSFNIKSLMDTSLDKLFSTSKPDSLGTGKAKPLFDMVMKYTDKSPEEVLNMALTAVNIAKDSKARLEDRRNLIAEINELNPHFGELSDNRERLEGIRENLSRFNETGFREEISLARYKELQSLRSRKDLSSEEKDRLKTLERRVDRLGDDDLYDTIKALTKGVETHHKEWAKLQQELSKNQAEKTRLDNLVTNLPPDSKARIALLQAELSKSRKAESSRYKIDKKPTIQDIMPESRAQAFASAYHAVQVKDDYSGTCFARNENGNLAVMADISLSNDQPDSSIQQVNIADNDPKAPLIIAGVEEATLTCPNLKTGETHSLPLR